VCAPFPGQVKQSDLTRRESQVTLNPM